LGINRLENTLISTSPTMLATLPTAETLKCGVTKPHNIDTPPTPSIPRQTRHTLRDVREINTATLQKTQL